MFVKDLGGTLMPACHLECPYYRVLAYRYSAGSSAPHISHRAHRLGSHTTSRKRKLFTMTQPILSQIPSSEGQRCPSAVLATTTPITGIWIHMLFPSLGRLEPLETLALTLDPSPKLHHRSRRS